MSSGVSSGVSSGSVHAHASAPHSGITGSTRYWYLAASRVVTLTLTLTLVLVLVSEHCSGVVV
jgi:hypothetical protein